MIEVAVKAEEIWGPALGGREREESLKQAIDSVENSRGIVEARSLIADCIKRKDYDKLVEEYTKARKYTDDARNLAENASRSQIPLTDAQIYQLVITGRMWTEVQDRVNSLKREVWKKLTNVQSRTTTAGRNANDDYMSLISILLELGVEDSPIWVWLLSRYDYLKNKISSTFERSRVEIEVLRRRLANGDKPASSIIARHLRNPSRHGQGSKGHSLDTPQVIELWELIYTAISGLISVQGGVLGEVLDFWDKAQSFIDGKIQRTLPNGIDGTSRRHHRLSTDGIRDLQNGAVELVDMLRESVNSFFAEPPIEDVSLLFSPLTPNTPKSALLSPYDSRFQFDANNPPPTSPKRGESWEEFAFWPPYANSLSTVHYLGKLLKLIGIAASEMISLQPIGSGVSPSEKLKSLVGVARERSAKAACAAWNIDAEHIKFLEDWTRPNEKRDTTNFPSAFEAYEMAVMQGVQKIMYIPEATTSRPNSVHVITPPPSKSLQTIRAHFVESLYKTMAGMVENARTDEEGIDTKGTLGDWTINRTPNPISRVSINPTSHTQLTSTQPVRLLLTLSNLRLLSTTIIPTLTSNFETLFSCTLTSETPQIRSTLSHHDTDLFNTCTNPIATHLTSLITAGIASPSWPPTTSPPTEVRPYIYTALLSLVSVHTEVSTTTPSLTHPILSSLNSTISLAFYSAFASRPRYPLPALMQATIDVEFVAHTLLQYTSSQGADAQSRTYELLDQRTDDKARERLREELGEMKGILRRLREGTRGEFGCFRRVRGALPSGR